MPYPYPLAPALCRGCGQEFTPTDPRQTDCKKGCGRFRRERQTNDWLLANRPHLPTEPCLNCGKPVVQYRTRRRDGELRYCGTKCRPITSAQDPILMVRDRAAWPPLVTSGAAMAVRRGCLDCGTNLKQGRCKRHGDKRELLLKQLRTRIKWLLPRACLNCNREFNRFDQGGVCDACHAKVRSATKATRRARIAGALRKDQGICHQELHRIFNGTCQLCGNKTQPPEVWVGWDGKTAMPYAPTVDHIIPLAKAGTHTWDNVQLAHALCNSFKNAS